MTDVHFSTITELPGSKATREQLQRAVNRYGFAAELCRGKDVLELACGAGLGLGMLKKHARSLCAGDIDDSILDYARKTYGTSIDLRCIDAQNLPFEDDSFDVVILFEAIYYLPQPERFVQEARRVLRNGGVAIVCNPNKDLPDFNPSPFSYRYFNAPEFRELFEPLGFEVNCYVDWPIDTDSLKARLFSFIKRWAVALNLMPKTMKGKEPLKRLVFGKLVEMPSRIDQANVQAQPLSPVSLDRPDTSHEYVFCVARVRGKNG
ncbi:MAG: class I SAM-dependent methyltransferase [Deltaproteobacteria bacterium]|nr:class I SAM-dependent methyltransferase [Deltaproteobacteria bacterium]